MDLSFFGPVGKESVQLIEILLESAQCLKFSIGSRGYGIRCEMKLEAQVATPFKGLRYPLVTVPSGQQLRLVSREWRKRAKYRGTSIEVNSTSNHLAIELTVGWEDGGCAQSRSGVL